MPDFDFSPDRLTSTSAGIVSRFAEDSLASEWHSSQRLLTVFALRLWRWPMKCQRNASPYRACFASRSWARFSPTTSIPASSRAPRSSAATYLVAATIVTSGPSSALMRSKLEPTVSADNCDDALGSTRPPHPPFGEEQIGVAGGAEVEPLDWRGTGLAQRAIGS